MRQVSPKHRRFARAGTALATLLLAVGLQSPAVAKKNTRSNASTPPPVLQSEPARSMAGTALDKIIQAVERRHPGARVRKADPIVENGRKVYVLRLQKDGKVSHIKVDAETGKEL